MNFKEKYTEYNENIVPDPALVRETTELVRNQVEEGRIRRREVAFRVVRGMVAAAAACLCLMFVVPVLAASEPIYRLMSLVSPELAQRFRPVQEADEDKGIRMEVVSAYIHDNEAQVYVTLQDLTEDRIDETLDLYDSYFIQTPFDCSATCRLLGYDQETRTATLLITIWQWEDREIAGDKVTFSLRGFISRKKNYEDLAIPIPLTEAEENAPSRMEYLLGRSGEMSWGKDRDDKDSRDKTSGVPNPATKVLIPGEADPRFPVDGMECTGIGYVDGLLHIQIAAPNHLRNDNHGFVYLKDAEGNILGYDGSVHFRKWVGREDEQPINTTSDQEHVSYTEYIFNISREELTGYSLYGNFVTSEVQVEGKWSVTIPLEEE